jgi:hypothetical protein
MMQSENNESGLVNSMTRREIIFFIADAKKRLTISFSWTKSTTGVKNGYPTMPLRTRKAAKSESGSSPPKQEKAPSCTRVLVHSVMWRFWNGFQKIPNCRLVQEPEEDSFFDLTDEEKAARDEKAALKALPSSGENQCEVSAFASRTISSIFDEWFVTRSA